MGLLALTHLAVPSVEKLMIYKLNLNQVNLYILQGTPKAVPSVEKLMIYKLNLNQVNLYILQGTPKVH